MNAEEQHLWDTQYKRASGPDYIGIRVYCGRVYYIKSFKKLWADYAEPHIKAELLKKDWSRGFVDYAKRLNEGL